MDVDVGVDTVRISRIPIKSTVLTSVVVVQTLAFLHTLSVDCTSCPLPLSSRLRLVWLRHSLDN